MRWLEWGARSYHDFALGLALLLIAAAIVGTTAVPRPIAYLIGLSGITYLVQGWVVGSEGFSQTHTILILMAWALTLAWIPGHLLGGPRHFDHAPGGTTRPSSGLLIPADLPGRGMSRNHLLGDSYDSLPARSRGEARATVSTARSICLPMGPTWPDQTGTRPDAGHAQDEPSGLPGYG
jgi:hypothetical protein